MEKEKYDFIRILDRTFYEFHSDGPNGKIRKEIQFDLMQKIPSIFNLALGKSLDNNEIDALSVTGNKDTAKILSVVSEAIVDFLFARNDALVYIKGSTPARTRLFQIWISKVLNHPKYSSIWIDGKFKNRWTPFEKGVAFEAFLVGKNNSI